MHSTGLGSRVSDMVNGKQEMCLETKAGDKHKRNEKTNTDDKEEETNSSNAADNVFASDVDSKSKEVGVEDRAKENGD